jgi:transposase
METNGDRMTVDARSDPPEAAGAHVGCLLEQLAAAERRAEQAEQRAVAVQQQAEQAEQIARLAELKNQKLTLELAYYKRLYYAAKSEHYHGEQLELFDRDMEADLASIEAELETTPPVLTRPKRANAGRRPLPPELPRVECRHEPAACTCGQCGGALTFIRDEVTEQLDIEPGRFFVRRHIRPQYACRHCETVVAEPAPPAIIGGGVAAPGLLAWVVIQKYLDHLPLYRLEAMTKRYGLEIPRPTMAGWVGQVGVALQPLVDRLAELLKQRRVLHADETPVQQLDPGHGKTRRAYLWAYRSCDCERGPPIAVFDYRTSRSGAHARDFLSGWDGCLMVDDYAGYKALFGQGVTELGCWAHARRKFFELHAANKSSMAAEALERIGELYGIERRGQELDAAGREALRRAEAQPQLKALHAWLTQARRQAPNGSGAANAIDYTLKRWETLARYAESGELPIDNNAVENVIRPIALGRKNWLFAGTERAGKRAAAIQSLLATAKLNDIEPYAWLKDTLEKLPTWPNRRIDELLPLRP